MGVYSAMDMVFSFFFFFFFFLLRVLSLFFFFFFCTLERIWPNKKGKIRNARNDKILFFFFFL
jgi:hypothetical protein